MTFTIRWSRQAERFLGKLPRQIAHRIVAKVNTIRDDPFRFLEHYEGAAIFKLRIGNYRLLMDVDLKTSTISVRLLGHRRNIYKDTL
jgi:mRNA interferase RelE/StbE